MTKRGAGAADRKVLAMRVDWLKVLVAALLAASAVHPASAEIKQAAPDAMILVHEVELRAAPSAAYAAIGKVGEWWSGDHTYSGEARNLTLELRAGACFCERWPGGSVEHGRVVLALDGQMVRFEGALGPLQDMAVSAVMTFQLAPSGGGTRVTATYRVAGNQAHGLDKLAAVVDRVLGEQVTRLARFVDGPSPKPAP